MKPKQIRSQALVYPKSSGSQPKCCRVCTGNEKPRKSWNFRNISFHRPGKSWNLQIKGQPWKILKNDDNCDKLFRGGGGAFGKKGKNEPLKESHRMNPV